MYEKRISDKALRKALGKREKEELRRRNIRDFFLYFSRPNLEWLHNLVAKYKERGKFPMTPMAVLPSFFDDSQDKEVAMFAGLLMSLHADYDKIQQMRELLGESPWEWFRSRKFVHLGVGGLRNRRTGGVSNWKIAKLFDILWGVCRISSVTSPNGHDVVFLDTIYTAVVNQAKMLGCSYADAMYYLLKDCYIGYPTNKYRLLLLVSGTSDAIGQGVWTVDPSEMKSPITMDLKRFLATFFPDYKKYGKVDDAIRLFGFERDCDFFYCFLAYKELQKRNPKGCRSFATKCHNWYNLGYKRKKNEWRNVQPEIVF